jgi:hypothetical protein
MAQAISIPPRRWLGFFGEPSTGAVKVERLPAIPIEQRRWLAFIPAPSANGNAAFGLSAVGGMFAVGLMAAVLATGGEAEGNESDGNAHEATALDEPGEAIAHASVVADPEPEPTVEPPTIEPTPAIVAPMDAPTTPLVEDRRVPTRPTIEPMSPTQLRKAQRVAKQLEAALAEGDVKTSALSFAVVVDSQGTFWSDASTICSELSIDGVTGWRLPSIAELRDLGRARVLPGAAYWSRTRGRDVEMARVYNTRTRRSGTWLASEPTGSAVCVQPRPRPPQD